MNELLSRDDWVNEKELFTDSPIPAVMLDESLAVFAALKKPGTEAGALVNVWADKLAFWVTAPEPTTDGISRKLIGIFCETRTMFSKILSLLYCSTTSR